VIELDKGGGAMLSSMSTSAFIADWNDSPPFARPDRKTYQQRALFMWPGLDRRRLRRTEGDPWKIARLVASRTSLSLEAIFFLLMGPEIDGRVETGV
jgi:hypothetical protein